MSQIYATFIVKKGQVITLTPNEKNYYEKTNGPGFLDGMPRVRRGGKVCIGRCKMCQMRKERS